MTKRKPPIQTPLLAAANTLAAEIEGATLRMLAHADEFVDDRVQLIAQCIRLLILHKMIVTDWTEKELK